MIRKLLFVYDADSGALGAMIDGARKMLKLNGCPLCVITHGVAGERGEWQDCRSELGVEVEYLHRNELGADVREATSSELPCVLATTDIGLELVLGREVLERCLGSVPDFKGRLMHHAAAMGLTLESRRR